MTIKKADKFRVLRCNHIFCKSCIANWFSQCARQHTDKTCPSCRHIEEKAVRVRVVRDRSGREQAVHDILTHGLSDVPLEHRAELMRQIMHSLHSINVL